MHSLLLVLGMTAICVSISLAFYWLFEKKILVMIKDIFRSAKINGASFFFGTFKLSGIKLSGKLIFWVSILAFFLVFIVAEKVILALISALLVFGILKYLDSVVELKKSGIIKDQLLGALGVIANSLRAGSSIVQALETSAKEIKEPLGIEFEKVIKQVKLGLPLEKALQGLAERNDCPDLKIAVISINLAKETGGNIPEIVTKIAELMREKGKIKGKIDSLTAQGRMSGIVMSSIPFILMGILYFIDPSTIGLLFSNVIGNMLLLIAVIMILLGSYFIKKIVEIDI